jgi:drug/metabolite transporter (DMT)-like permease
MTAFRGTLLIVFANIFFAMSHTLVKLLSESLPVTHMMFFRFISGPVLLLPFFLYTKKTLVIRNKKMLLARTFFGVSAMYLYFYSMTLTDIGKATLIFNFSTIWAIALSMMLFKEQPSIQTKWAIPIAFIGLYLVLKPEHIIFISLGDTCALVASFFNAGVVLSLKKLRKNNSTENVVFFNYLLSACVVFIPFSGHWVLPSYSQWSILCMIGAIGVIGQLLMTTGYKYAPASISGSVSLIAAPIMLINGWIFFGQQMDALSIIGITLVLLSLVVVTKFR